MAYETPLLDLAYTTNSDLSTFQYHAVKLVGDSAVGTCSATTDTPLGILQNKPGSAQAAAVRLLGVSKWVAGAAMGAGSFAVTLANAKGSTSATGVSSSYALGLVVDGVTASGEVASVALLHPGRSA